MEKFSSISRIVGKLTEAQKKQALLTQKNKFIAQALGLKKEGEMMKTPEQMEIINLANDASNELRRKYGMKDFNIPPGNIHIVPKESWNEEDGCAFYASGAQSVEIMEEPALMVFTENTLHEIMHFKSYNALQLTMEEGPRIVKYRLGFEIVSRDAKRIHFSNLNEAVTSEITKRMLQKIFNKPLFAKEREETKKLAEKYSHLRGENGNPFFGKETYHAKSEGENVTVSKYCYAKEREVFGALIKKLLEKNPERFHNENEVFEVFEKGMVTGNILPIGKLIDGTFGTGVFRKIGGADDDLKSQRDFIESL